MSTPRDSSLEEDSDENFELTRSHAYTFPFLSPDIYGDNATNATSQTSLISRSRTPPVNRAGDHDPREFELESLLPKQENSEQSRFHEELLPPSSGGPGHHSPPAQKYVSWGVSLKQPIIMLLFLVLGISTALVHHFYYRGLMGSIAGNTARQQGVIWFGTGLNNVTLFFLNSANGIALTQAIWWTVKRHAMTIGGLDNLFALSTDITGFINFELLRRAKIAIIIAFIFWGMVLTAVIPPGTISVISSQTPMQTTIPKLDVPTFNWTLASDCGALLSFETFSDGVVIAYPPPQTLRIASQVSQNMFVSPPSSSPSNSTYTQQFLGPALQCNPATPLQQQAFDYYNEASFNETGVITASRFVNSGSPLSFPNEYNFLQFFTAFSPQLYESISDVHPVPGETDHYNNWDALLPANIRNLTNFSNAEFWIQLANSSIVCTLMNAEFDVGFEDINGTQSVVQNSVTYIDKWVFDKSETNYLGVMAAIGPMLYGNVSMIPHSCDIGNGATGECYSLSGSSSQVLQTGIAACEEFENSWWEQNINLLNATHTATPINFGTQSWMCRNGSVARALEDLSINFTVGLLGLELDEFKPIPTPITLTHFSTPNVYAYDSAKLLISYGSGIIATILCVLAGLLIFRSNGISHDTSFSAIMTTTRNVDLDRLSVGQSLCAIDEELEKTKLRFGGNRVGYELGGRLGGSEVERAAFGLEGKVEVLRKGGRYI